MKKLLVVDNDVDGLEAMQLLLSVSGYKVKTATSYKSLLNIVYSFQPDMVIMDVMLSGEDGRNICKDLKEDALTSNLCILLISGSPLNLIDYSSYQADGCLEKPFDQETLCKKIEGLLAKHALSLPNKSSLS